MVGVELNDEDCPDVIKKLVRDIRDIQVYDYVTRGSNGEVYFGKRQKLGDDVVLKFYIAGEDFDASEEAVILRNIDHPNILKIHDLRFIEPQYAYFLSPKISGGDLQGLIDGNTPIPSLKSLELISGILLGLTELHSTHGLVHRDLKPGNILVDLKSNTPIIADLGSVKKLVDANGYVTTSKATRVYLPSEAIVDGESYFQSDIYQVGITMYQILGGVFPLNNPDDWLTPRELKKLTKIDNRILRDERRKEIIDEKIVNGKIADTNKLPFYLDQSFKRVLNKALHTDYTKRYKSPSEFLTAIHALIRQHPNYTVNDDHLLIQHKSQTDYMIYENRKNELILEKRLKGKAWRKNNSHNGDINKALSISRIE